MISKGIILAGGSGTRLYPLTCDRQEKCDPLAWKKLIHQRQEKSDPLRALRWKKSDPPLPMATPLPSAIGTRA
jgi:hypothetical protein